MLNTVGKFNAFKRDYVSAIKTKIGLPNPKVFCIGRNKTGTTSLQHALIGLGYRLGDQPTAELLIEDWGRRDFRRLIRYCHSADAFQDVPFSYHYTFQALDAAFPGSKFILTVRNSDDEWYQSVVRFHTLRLKKRMGVDRIPTLEDIKSDPYRAPGWIWRVREIVGIEGEESYPEDQLKAYYNRHNEIIQDYFRHRANDFLVLNLSEADSMRRLCGFLGKPYSGQTMPKLNQSQEG
jgi:hypothetical protein